jgi:hypothetical protein
MERCNQVVLCVAAAGVNVAGESLTRLFCIAARAKSCEVMVDVLKSVAILVGVPRS